MHRARGVIVLQAPRLGAESFSIPSRPSDWPHTLLQPCHERQPAPADSRSSTTPLQPRCLQSRHTQTSPSTLGTARHAGIGDAKPAVGRPVEPPCPASRQQASCWARSSSLSSSSWTVGVVCEGWRLPRQRGAAGGPPACRPLARAPAAEPATPKLTIIQPSPPCNLPPCRASWRERLLGAAAHPRRGTLFQRFPYHAPLSGGGVSAAE